MGKNQDQPVVCIVGLGYVGLPLAEVFSKKLKVIGFDTDARKADLLSQRNESSSLFITTNPEDINQADFVIICVPTPLTKSKEPDLSYIRSAARVVSQNMKRDCVVILESTVYPGVTEEIMKPILEESGLKCGKDFKIGYAPERINPGDRDHTVNLVTKVVSGMDEETTDKIAWLYGTVAPNVFKAKNIKSAEAAKVIENIQRDINIALMNELVLIFDKLGLRIEDVLEPASTKWNFHMYHPGLVGGHCIPVDPHYLVYKAKELGYHPQIILAGRAINDYMPKYVSEIAIKALNTCGKVIKGSKILIMGLTYKENVGDIRETPVKWLINELKEYQVEVFGYDPLVDNIEDSFNIKGVSNLETLSGIDGVIVILAHNAFKEITLNSLKEISADSPILIDVRGLYDRPQAEKIGFYYKKL